MLYFSTRDPSRQLRSFSEIVLEGLAPDGGLYIPQGIPPLGELSSWSCKSHVEAATALLRLYAPELEAQIGCSFKQLSAESVRRFRSPEVTPLRHLGCLGQSPLYIGELFCGPTYSFKDVALQFLGQVFERLLHKQGRRLTLLGATSGDTGGAAIHGVRGMRNIRLCILHPHNAISAVQRRQMCCVLNDNICNIAVRGNFDQCQSMVKELMECSKRGVGIPQLGAINSINWGRILAQITYYFVLYFRCLEQSGLPLGSELRFVVPTGNFGNALAGYFARRMGLPIRLLLATNQNDILHQCLATGLYRSKGRFTPSFAPAMDIVQPSNFERYLWYLLDGRSEAVCEFLRRAQNAQAEGKELSLPFAAHRQLCRDFHSCCATDAEILRAILDCHQNYGYVLDPHTACAYHACLSPGEQQLPTICLATAHPAKFPEVYDACRNLAAATGRTSAPEPGCPEGLDFSGLEERSQVIDADSKALLQYLRQNFPETAHKQAVNPL